MGRVKVDMAIYSYIHLKVGMAIYSYSYIHQNVFKGTSVSELKRKAYRFTWFLP
jgi:hypothetical protein